MMLERRSLPIRSAPRSVGSHFEWQKCAESNVIILCQVAIIFLPVKMMCKDGECSSINIVVICSACFV